jgi:hypothetical protein
MNDLNDPPDGIWTIDRTWKFSSWQYTINCNGQPVAWGDEYYVDHLVV